MGMDCKPIGFIGKRGCSVEGVSCVMERGDSGKGLERLVRQLSK
jgi:hypothetical protein